MWPEGLASQNWQIQVRRSSCTSENHHPSLVSRIHISSVKSQKGINAIYQILLLKTIRELLLYKVCGNSTLLVPNVLNGTTLNSVNTLLAIGRWYTPVSIAYAGWTASRLWPVPEFAHWQLQIASSHPLREFYHWSFMRLCPLTPWLGLTGGRISHTTYTIRAVVAQRVRSQLWGP